MASEKKRRPQQEKIPEKLLNTKTAPAAEDTRAPRKKARRNDEYKERAQEPKKPERKTEKEDRAEQKPAPRSAGILHQFVPFILFALALLLFTFLVAVELFTADMGIAGEWISRIFCGLFGWGAFFIPVILVFLGIVWMKMIDNGNVKSKTVISIISMITISVIIHVFYTADTSNFSIVDLWKDGEALRGGGVIGGFICECFVFLFEKLGTLIISVSCLAIALMFLFNLTPRNIWTYVKYKRKLNRERRLERAAEEKERRAAEAERIELELRAADIRKRALEDKKKNVVVITETPDETSEPEPPKEEKKEPARTPAEDPMKQIDVYFPKTEPAEEEKLPEPEPLPEKEPEELHEDDDGVHLEHIFSSNDEPEKRKGSIISIDLPAKGAEKPRQTTEKKPVAEKSEKQNGNVVVSMKVDTEALSELESLRADDKEEVELKAGYVYPPTDLLHEDTNPKNNDGSEEVNEKAKILRETLASFNIGVKDEILCSRGPTITRYELRPEVGVRVRSIANLVDDISLSLATSGVRIEAPIPNKPYVGIEVPNAKRLTVFLRSLIEHDKFVNDPGKLTACLGSDVGGHPVFFDITKMPHLLIAGATGMGKSVCINSIIMSILYKASPDEVKLILIDPKKVEFNIYKDIPHLYAPIVSDPKKAAGALASAVAEMERRFELIEDVGVRDINNYNAITADDPDREYLPKMVIIIDELADLMMTAPGEVESSICRLAQKARAAGIHIIIGTQRPSVDVITGLIKANVPSRIACTVASQVDSRTIIDIAGAEKLIGRGDMLFAPVGISKPMRVQGAFVSDAEVEAVVEFIKANNNKAEYNKEFISIMESEAAKCGNSSKKGGGDEGGGDGGDDNDPKFREAVKLAIDAGKISTSLMQRMLGVGYGRAAKIIDRMEDLGYVSAPDGNKPRRVLITMQEYMEKVINDEIGEGAPSSEEDNEE